LRGKINTHASTLARRLASIGLTIEWEQTLGDELQPLADAISRASESFDVVIVTGGLGPTFDDLSREAAARATGRKLVLSEALLRRLVKKFRNAGFPMPPANRRQAWLVEGARPIENLVGTAPGQWYEQGNKVLILLPGPPSELNPMLEKFVLPMLAKKFPARPSAEAHLHFVGVPESVVDQRVRPLILRAQKISGAEFRFTILAHLGLVDFDTFVSHARLPRAKQALASLVREIAKRMGKRMYGMNEGYPLEKVVAEHFKSKKTTLSLAESCTGGLLSAQLTAIPGSSKFFLGGVVSYSNDVKAGALGVPKTLLAKHGAVSPEVARSMAENIRRLTRSTWGLSLTGIAGPAGGTPKKPVGLVYLGLSGARGSRAIEFRFSGSRDTIRQRAVIASLDLLRRL
jgi:nicotinamide-nucleotide amidase